MGENLLLRSWSECRVVPQSHRAPSTRTENIRPMNGAEGDVKVDKASPCERVTCSHRIARDIDSVWHSSCQKGLLSWPSIHIYEFEELTVNFFQSSALFAL
jgi:hypothetical protein